MIQESVSSQYWRISSCTWEGPCKLDRDTADSVLSPTNDIGPGASYRRISVMIMMTEKHVQFVNWLTSLGRDLLRINVNVQRELDKFGEAIWAWNRGVESIRGLWRCSYVESLKDLFMKAMYSDYTLNASFNS